MDLKPFTQFVCKPKRVALDFQDRLPWKRELSRFWLCNRTWMLPQRYLTRETRECVKSKLICSLPELSLAVLGEICLILKSSSQSLPISEEQQHRRGNTQQQHEDEQSDRHEERQERPLNNLSPEEEELSLPGSSLVAADGSADIDEPGPLRRSVRWEGGESCAKFIGAGRGRTVVSGGNGENGDTGAGREIEWSRR